MMALHGNKLSVLPLLNLYLHTLKLRAYALNNNCYCQVITSVAISDV